MKILLTGSKGMLGSDLTKILNKEHELIATDSNLLDIVNLNQVKKQISYYKPDIIINSAAYADVDGCESNQELAYEVNAVGAKNLAIASLESESTLIHISTDYVFNGKNSYPYLENDKTDPINVYGETKLQGEKFIQNILNSYFIIRTSWLYGLNGDNFVKTMLKLANTNEKLNVVMDQIGSPTYTQDLAVAISKLINKYNCPDFYGIYNITNSGSCSWFDFAKSIFEIANIDILLKPVSTEEFPRPANRPKYSVLSNEKWKRMGFEPLKDCKNAIKEYIGLII